MRTDRGVGAESPVSDPTLECLRRDERSCWTSFRFIKCPPFCAYSSVTPRSFGPRFNTSSQRESETLRDVSFEIDRFVFEDPITRTETFYLNSEPIH